MPLFGRKKGPLEVYYALDKPEVKVVTAEYNGKPFFTAIATAKGRAKKIKGGISVQAISGKGAYDSEIEYDWRIFLHRESKPDWFPEEQFELLATNATTAVSGSMNAQKAEIIPISDKTEFSIVSVPTRISISDKGIKIRKKKTRKSKK